jgi:hypothetical protein
MNREAVVVPATESNPTAPQRAGWPLSVWCVTAAFGAYFCMYAFRTPFTAATYAEPIAPAAST